MCSYQTTKFDIDDDILAITFDAVGTLIVPCLSVGEIYAQELSTLGYDLSSDLLEKNFIDAFNGFKDDYPDAVLDSDSWRAIVANTLFGLTPEDDFDRQFGVLWSAFSNPKRWSLLPGVDATLQNLHEDGLRLFVLSNNDERLRLILEGLEIDRYFEEIFVSTELGVPKPSKRIFEIVQARIQVSPLNILHVGDNPIEDIQGAIHAGWNAALVHPNAEAYNNLPIFKRAKNIRELFVGYTKGIR